ERRVGMAALVILSVSTGRADGARCGISGSGVDLAGHSFASIPAVFLPAIDPQRIRIGEVGDGVDVSAADFDGAGAVPVSAGSVAFAQFERRCRDLGLAAAN